MSTARSANDRSSGEWRYAAGWWCFAALLLLVPVVVAAPLKGSGGAPLGALLFNATELPKLALAVVLASASAALFAFALVTDRVKLRWHPVLWLVLALPAWVAISAASSASPRLAVFGEYVRNDGLVAALAYALVAFLAVQYVRDGASLRRLAMVVTLAAVPVAVYAIAQRFGVEPLAWGPTDFVGRPWSTFGNPNMLGDYLIVPLTFAIGLAVSSPSEREAGGWWALGGVVAVALALTLTRGAWIGAAVSVAAVTVVAWRRGWRASRTEAWVLGVAALVLVLLIVSVVVTTPGLLGRILDPGTSGAAGDVTNGRLLIWKAGLESAIERPLTGWGPGSFARAFAKSAPEAFYVTGKVSATVDDAHNFLVQALVTLGIPGLALVLGTLGWTLSASSRRAFASLGNPALSVYSAAWAALCGLCVALLFGVSVPSVLVWLWLLVGVLAAPRAAEVDVARSVATGSAVATVVIALAAVAWMGTWIAADHALARAASSPTAERVEPLRTAVALNPLVLQYRLALGSALNDQAVIASEQGASAEEILAQVRSAVKVFETAAAIDSGDVQSRLQIAAALNQAASALGDSSAPPRALAAAREAWALSPSDPEVLVQLALAYSASGDSSRAAETAQAALRIAPDYAKEQLASVLASSTPGQ